MTEELSGNRRLGTTYRNEVMHILYGDKFSGKVLDVGCYDGFHLSNIEADLRVGADPQPKGGAPGLVFVQADGRFLPFANKEFDFVFALDVIEHIEDDLAFAKSLMQVVSSSGRIILSTPNINIRIFPSFLTRWVSIKWGHYYRLGYSPEMLRKIFGSGINIKIRPWNAFYFRLFYLPLRFLYQFFPRFSTHIVKNLAHFDARISDGDHGYLILEAYPESTQGPAEVNKQAAWIGENEI
jgi:SAM-dependent methyltransferase